MKAAKFFPVTNGSCCHCDDYQQFRTIVNFLLEVSLVKVYSCKTEKKKRIKKRLGWVGMSFGIVNDY